MAFDPWSVGLGVVGAGANLLGGMSQANASKEMLRRQAQGASLANQTYKQAMPTYQELLNQYARQAGIGPGAQQFDQYGLDPQRQLALRMNEEQIGRQQQQQANQLRFQLGQRGEASASIGAALGRNAQQAGQATSDFRRNMFINAPNVQQQRLAALQAALGPAFGQGAQASQVYGQQGAMFGNQASQSFAGVGSSLGQLAYQNQLQNSPYGMYGGGYGYGGYGGQAPTGYYGADQPNPNPYGTDYRPQLQQAPQLGYGSRF